MDPGPGSESLERQNRPQLARPGYALTEGQLRTDLAEGASAPPSPGEAGAGLLAAPSCWPRVSVSQQTTRCQDHSLSPLILTQNCQSRPCLPRFPACSRQTTDESPSLTHSDRAVTCLGAGIRWMGTERGETCMQKPTATAKFLKTYQQSMSISG